MWRAPALPVSLRLALPRIGTCLLAAPILAVASLAALAGCAGIEGPSPGPRPLTPEERKRFDPMITGFNPADMYGVDHIRRVLRTFPGVFTGIGEFSIHKEFVSGKVAGDTATLFNPALDRIFVARVDDMIGAERESVEGVQLGTLDLTMTSTGPVPNFVPEIAILDIPFLFRDYAHARAVLDEAKLTRERSERLQQQGLIAQAQLDTAISGLAVAEGRSVETVETLAGELKIQQEELRRTNDELQDNMVFTIEPGIYITGWGGVRIDDVVGRPLGHALHFANVRSDYPFEYRWLGDNSVTESYAMLMDHRIRDRLQNGAQMSLAREHPLIVPYEFPHRHAA